MAHVGELLNATDIQQRIDAYHELHRQPPRAHLGLSLLGHPCDRYIWLNFRWAMPERFSGRMLRLFRRGQREEETIVCDLRAMGISIHSTCLDSQGQSRVDWGGHVSGSVDGIIEGGVPGAEKTRHIAEFKTHNLRSFNELKAKGVYEAKKRHWWQMQGYMLGTGIDRALYVAVCKDNDEMYTERVKLDKEKAEALLARGVTLSLLEHLPLPLSTDPSWWQCKMCSCHDFCHISHTIKEINCRTCAHVTPMANGTFTCAFFDDAVVPVDKQREGCFAHVIHPEMVPWALRGAEGACARYVINGTEYLNGDPYHNNKAKTTAELLDISADVNCGKIEDIPF